ncbi:hypothetical protein NP493_1847g00002 [Ridgeia piscesae]|uniref:Uncharacterized protein n=1 Tax=Ridgeia piscesae TaxID=27915 RepID=A0AAD9JTD4_RIDPI|nr:hypothetical protein NP493_1847g00002 [Ridgeia piscesae]
MVQFEAVLKVGDASIVDNFCHMFFCLWQLEESVCDRHKLGITKNCLQLSILHRNLGCGKETWSTEPDLLCYLVQILPPEGPSNTLTPQHFVFPDLFRQISVGIDVTKEKFSSFLQDAAGLRENSAFVRGQVHNTIGHDQVKLVVLQTGCSQTLDVTLHKVSVGFAEAELVSMILLVLPRHLQLFICHVDACHMAFLSDQSTQDVTVLACSGSQVKDLHPFQTFWHYQTTVIVSTKMTNHGVKSETRSRWFLTVTCIYLT